MENASDEKRPGQMAMALPGIGLGMLNRPLFELFQQRLADTLADIAITDQDNLTVEYALVDA